jgi:hypothetical protein
VASVPFLIVLSLFPLVYCITHPEVYYRRPIDPLFVVLAVYAVTAFLERRRSRASDARIAKPSGDGPHTRENVLA